MPSLLDPGPEPSSPRAWTEIPNLEFSVSVATNEHAQRRLCRSECRILLVNPSEGGSEPPLPLPLCSGRSPTLVRFPENSLLALRRFPPLPCLSRILTVCRHHRSREIQRSGGGKGAVPAGRGRHHCFLYN